MVETLNQLRYGRKLYRDATDVPRHVQPTLIFIYRAWKLKVLLKERKGKKEGEGGKKKKNKWQLESLRIHVLKRFDIALAIFKFFHDARSRNENWILTLHGSVLSRQFGNSTLYGVIKEKERKERKKICKKIY